MSDYIRRDDVYQFGRGQLDVERGAYSKGRNDGLRILMSAARNPDAIPSADVWPVVRGKWVWDGDRGNYRCEKCGCVSPMQDQNENYINCPNYCHNCGADMREEATTNEEAPDG